MFLSLYLLIFLFNDCRLEDNNLTELPDSLIEEYKVYDALIDSMYVVNDIKHIVIEDSSDVFMYKG